MIEIDRILFVSLNVDNYMYYILNDGNYVEHFYAINDDEAKRIFHKKYGK